MSILSKLKGIQKRLELNQALQNYCTEKFGRELKVKRVFKNRIEINLNELPLIMITRPRVNRATQNGVISKSHSVFLYIGFSQEDLLKAQDNIVELDELVEVAVNERQTGDVPLAITVEDSVNDEGMYHPVYFNVTHLTVKDR